MANSNHVTIVKQGAETIRQWREEHPDERLDLAEANLQGANLQGANLQGAYLAEANLQGANLQGAYLVEANLQGANLIGTHLTGASLTGVSLTGASLQGASLQGASLQGADLQGAELQGANLTGANLTSANLTSANLTSANLQRVTLDEANLSRALLKRVQKVHQARFLETVQCRPNDALYFETCQRRWSERWLDWEGLRVVGRLPLFGASYTALILIPLVFYGLAVYNDYVELVRTGAMQVRMWAEQTPTLPIHLATLLERLMDLALWHLHPRPIPQQSLLLVVSTILLAAGATLYTFFCPSRIKEFSRTQWCDQFGRSLLHYWPLAWKYRSIRLVCAACYGLGGAGALWVIGTKVWRVLLFILQYSKVPWPWRVFGA